MAETAVISVIDKLSSLLSEELKLLKGVHKEVSGIKSELESIRSFLKDADARAEKEDFDNGVKVWVKQVSESAFEIEDVVDEYVILVASQRCYHRRGFFKFVCRIGGLIGNLKSRYEIASRIQDIKSSIREIRERSLRYGFNSSENRLSNYMKNFASCDPRVGSYFVDENEVVGIDCIKDELIGFMVAGAAERQVVSVVGMGGLGKTTISKIVFDSGKVKEHFECHAWITVSQSYKKEELLRNLMRQFCQARKESAPEGIDSMEEVLLIGKLRGYLQEKKYVVVFDDVWKVDFWGDIEHAVPNNDKGSRILITTRIKDVSDFCKKSSFVHVHELQPLLPNKAWELFCMKAFRFDFEGHCPMELEKLSREIVKKCKGLPLAIVAIGGLLSTKDKDLLEWKKLHDTLGSELESNPHLTNITKILSLSYHDLPYYLKSCFLYFGIYPEDYSISHPNLTTQWIAEGFVKGKKGKTLEEVADEYVVELVRRNLVQKSWGKFNGVNQMFQIHDLMREIILSKFGELSFCQVVEQTDSSFNGKTRRLSIFCDIYNILKTIEKSGVRSLFLFKVNRLPKTFLVELIENFKLLKVLYFDDTPLDVLPDEVGYLFHLSYLSVRNTKIKVIPKSIGNLLNLQTLDIRLTLVSSLPAEINRLRKLRHLFAYRYIPEINFRFGFIEGVKIHEGIGCLQDLQTLFHVEANHGVGVIKELEKLKLLKVLGISNLTRVDGKALCASIDKMNQLESLDLITIRKDEILDLESVSSAPQYMRDIFLRGHLQKLPHWLQELQNLVTICLYFSGFNDNPLKTLQALPSLENVYLYEAYNGELLRIEEGGFQKLKLLSLRDMHRLNTMVIAKGALPHLEELHIGSSPQLKEVPASIHDLSGLKTLLFYDMPNEFAVRMLPYENIDFWKVEHVQEVLLSYRIVGERYETYKLGDPNLLQHLRTRNTL